MANPYQPPSDSPLDDGSRNQNDTTELREFVISLVVFITVGTLLYGVGKSLIPLVDEQSNIDPPLYIYMAIFFVTFIAQPMNEIGFVICDIFSCVIWGWIAVKICKRFKLIPTKTRRKTNKGQPESVG